jgi:hypothetical protein
MALILRNAFASPQAFAAGEPRNPTSAQPSTASVCQDKSVNSVALAVLRIVCQQPIIAHESLAPGEQIVIGFLGGFVQPNDRTHPEVLFADYLRQHYAPALHVQTFFNHDEQAAVAYVTRLLDRNHDGQLSNEEKRSARIIVYGHSWGASQTAEFARDLGHHGIPVELTIQLDIIAKHGENPTAVASNVANAINFYQPRGPLHGRTPIVATDPAHTTILGNFKTDYSHSPVDCRNYAWFGRTFNKPHHEIENDPEVWNKIASLMHEAVTGRKIEP